MLLEHAAALVEADRAVMFSYHEVRGRAALGGTTSSRQRLSLSNAVGADDGGDGGGR